MRALRLLLSVVTFAVSAVGAGVGWDSGRLSLVMESVLEAAETCGNGVCDAGETKAGCLQDCRPLLKLLRQRRIRLTLPM